MKLDNERSSNNIEDRRGSGSGGGGGGGKIGGIAGLIIMLVGAYYGIDLSGLAGGMAVQQAQPQQQQSRPVYASREEEQLKQFARKILANTEDTWGEYFRRRHRRPSRNRVGLRYCCCCARCPVSW